MGIAREPQPAKYFVALLSSEINLLTSIESDLAALLGDIDGRSEILPWSLSDFYQKEFGPGLRRRFLSFAPLLSPERLAPIKLAAQAIEQRYLREPCVPDSRRINIDPGYLEAGKVVLASTKNASHRIYLHSGIFAEATLQYHSGAFHRSAYTYRDYLWSETLSFLSACRARYLQQLRQPA